MFILNVKLVLLVPRPVQACCGNIRSTNAAINEESKPRRDELKAEGVGERKMRLGLCRFRGGQ